MSQIQLSGLISVLGLVVGRDAIAIWGAGMAQPKMIAPSCALLMTVVAAVANRQAATEGWALYAPWVLRAGISVGKTSYFFALYGDVVGLAIALRSATVHTESFQMAGGSEEASMETLMRLPLRKIAGKHLVFEDHPAGAGFRLCDVRCHPAN